MFQVILHPYRGEGTALTERRYDMNSYRGIVDAALSRNDSKAKNLFAS